jgi:hypothetical protein
VRKMTVLGASALLVAGLMVSPAAAFAAPIAGAPVATTGDSESTCPKDGKVDVPKGEEPTSIEVTAESGYVIVGYCVKAGSDQQGDGPVEVVVDPPTTSVTITHPSGKAISHYTVYYEPVSTPSPSPSVPSEEPSVVPSDEPSGEPTEPGDEPSEGSVAPETGATPSPSPSASEPPVLAATGASTVIGFTLIALALVGGGVTLIVLRRKGVLGS